LEGGREQENAFGFEGAANAGKGSGELLAEERVDFGVRELFVGRTFEDVGEHEAEFLEFGEDGFGGLPFRGKLDGCEDGGGFALKRGVWGVEKLGVEFRSDAGKKESLDVDGTEAGGPGESFEAAGDVRGVCKLATAIAGEKDGIRHG
jgi:hypothetical protein